MAGRGQQLHPGCGRRDALHPPDQATGAQHRIVHPDAVINWDTSKPDGTPRKLLDISRLRALGWEPSVSLTEGLASTYEWFLSSESAGQELRGIDSV